MNLFVFEFSILLWYLWTQTDRWRDRYTWNYIPHGQRAEYNGRCWPDNTTCSRSTAIIQGLTHFRWNINGISISCIRISSYRLFLDISRSKEGTRSEIERKSRRTQTQILLYSRKR